MNTKIPYGRSQIECNISGAAVITSRIEEIKCSRSGRELVREAMNHPVQSERLTDLAKGKRTCTIIISDHTRPVPSKDILPEMLKDIREGNPAIDITLLVATGFHRGTTKAELIDKLGEEICAQEKIVVHDCQEAKSNVYIGQLPSGASLVIDRVAAETELLVAEGFIEPHFFAGFSGGRKSVLPGVCDKTTVLGNHCSKFIDSAMARAGKLDGNPLHRDMLEAARMAKLAFIVNVVIDDDKRTAAAFAGDPDAAHRAGCDYLKEYCEVDAVPADIVVTSNGGAPLDQNIYQCVKGLTAAEASANPGAVLIICAGLEDGHGGESFYQTLKECKSAASLYREIMSIPQDKTIPDQWESQVLARILIKHKVIFVASPKYAAMIGEMKMHWAATLEDAMDRARSWVIDNPKITVIPNGISVVVK